MRTTQIMNTEEEEALIEEYKKIPSLAYKRLLLDCGNLAWYQNHLNSTIKEYYKETELLVWDWDWLNIQKRTIAKMCKQFPMPPKVLQTILLRQDINLNEHVPVENWYKWHVSGILSIRGNEAHLPYLGLLGLIQDVPYLDLHKFGLCPMISSPNDEEECLMWQDWPTFNLQFLVMRIKSLFELLKEPKVPLNQILRNSHRSLKDLSILKCKPKYIASASKLGPDTVLKDKRKEDKTFELLVPGHCVKNVNEDEAVNGLAVLEYVSDTCQTPATLVLLYSCKRTETPGVIDTEPIILKKEEALEEYHKMKQDFEYSQGVKKIYIICTGKECRVHSDEFPEDLIVIGKYSFLSHFGFTFESKALSISASPRLNPNRCNPQEIPHIGPETAQRIIDYRNGLRNDNENRT